MDTPQDPFQIPEIRALILGHLSPSSLDLLHSALVCKAWLADVLPLLWKTISIEHCPRAFFTESSGSRRLLKSRMHFIQQVNLQPGDRIIGKLLSLGPCQNLVSINSNSVNDDHCYAVLDLIACSKRLRYLDLEYMESARPFDDAYAVTFVDLVNVLENTVELKSLTVGWTEVDYDTIDLLFRNCSRLKVLDIGANLNSWARPASLLVSRRSRDSGHHQGLNIGNATNTITATTTATTTLTSTSSRTQQATAKAGLLHLKLALCSDKALWILKSFLDWCPDLKILQVLSRCKTLENIVAPNADTTDGGVTATLEFNEIPVVEIPFLPLLERLLITFSHRCDQLFVTLMTMVCNGGSITNLARPIETAPLPKTTASTSSLYASPLLPSVLGAVDKGVFGSSAKYSRLTSLFLQGCSANTVLVANYLAKIFSTCPLLESVEHPEVDGNVLCQGPEWICTRMKTLAIGICGHPWKRRKCLDTIYGHDLGKSEILDSNEQSMAGDNCWVLYHRLSALINLQSLAIVNVTEEKLHPPNVFVDPSQHLLIESRRPSEAISSSLVTLNFGSTPPSVLSSNQSGSMENNQGTASLMDFTLDQPATEGTVFPGQWSPFPSIPQPTLNDQPLLLSSSPLSSSPSVSSPSKPRQHRCHQKYTKEKEPTRTPIGIEQLHTLHYLEKLRIKRTNRIGMDGLILRIEKMFPMLKHLIIEGRNLSTPILPLARSTLKIEVVDIPTAEE